MTKEEQTGMRGGTDRERSLFLTDGEKANECKERQEKVRDAQRETGKTSAARRVSRWDEKTGTSWCTRTRRALCAREAVLVCKHAGMHVCMRGVELGQLLPLEPQLLRLSAEGDRGDEKGRGGGMGKGGGRGTPGSARRYLSLQRGFGTVGEEEERGWDDRKRSCEHNKGLLVDEGSLVLMGQVLIRGYSQQHLWNLSFSIMHFPRPWSKDKQEVQTKHTLSICACFVFCPPWSHFIRGRNRLIFSPQAARDEMLVWNHGCYCSCLNGW